MSGYRIVTDKDLPKTSWYQLREAIRELRASPYDCWAVLPLDGKKPKTVHKRLYDLGRSRGIRFTAFVCGDQMYIKILNPEARRKESRRVDETRSDQQVRRDLA